MKKTLAQFEFQTQDGATYWLPLFIDHLSENQFITIEEQLNELLRAHVNEISQVTFQQFDEDSPKQLEVVGAYIEKKRNGELMVFAPYEKKEDVFQQLDHSPEINFRQDFTHYQCPVIEEKSGLTTLESGRKMPVTSITGAFHAAQTLHYTVVRLKEDSAPILPKPLNAKGWGRSTGFLIGLIVSMSLVLTAFNWRTSSFVDYDPPSHTWDDVEEEIILNTVQRKAPEPPKPRPENHSKAVAEPVFVEPEPDPKQMTVEFPGPDPDPIVIEGIAHTPEMVIEEKVFTIVERMPVFMGCEHIENDEERDQCTVEKMYSQLEEFQQFPREAVEMGITGTVYISFVIDQNGKVTNVNVLKGVRGGKMLDKEAERMVALLPTFVPGQQRMKNVSVRYNIPIKFTLK
jgi:protein TonB